MRRYLIVLFSLFGFLCLSCNCEFKTDFGSRIRQQLQKERERIDHEVAKIHERLHKSLENVHSTRQNLALNSFRNVPSISHNIGFNSFGNTPSFRHNFGNSFGNIQSRFRTSNVRNIPSFGFSNLNIPSARSNVHLSLNSNPFFHRSFPSITFPSFQNIPSIRHNIGSGFRGVTRQLSKETDEDSDDNIPELNSDENMSELESDERDPEIPADLENFLKPSENEVKLLNSVEPKIEDLLEDEARKEDSGTTVNIPAPLERLKRAHVKMPTGRRYRIPSPKPNHWSCRNSTSRKIDIKPHGWSKDQYTIVKKEMENTIAHHHGYSFTGYDIIKIQKIINGCLWKRYLHQQKDLKAESNMVNQRMLWHGSKFADDVTEYGFNEQYASINGMFGAGIYFAKHSSKSNQYVFNSAKASECPAHHDRNCKICERKLVLTRVSLGKSKVVYTMQRFYHAPAGGYHSVTALPSNQTKGLKYPEYIVYKGEQAYPEYLITYKLV